MIHRLPHDPRDGIAVFSSDPAISGAPAMDVRRASEGEEEEEEGGLGCFQIGVCHVSKSGMRLLELRL